LTGYARTSFDIAAPASLLFRLMARPERFPDFVPGVLRCRLVDGGLSRLVRFSLRRRVAWTQLEVLDEEKRRIAYRLARWSRNAPVSVLEGEWEVHEVSECSSVLSGWRRCSPVEGGGSYSAKAAHLIAFNLHDVAAAAKRRLEGI